MECNLSEIRRDWKFSVLMDLAEITWNEENREMILIISFFTGIPCRCFVMNTPLELAKHLNYVRQNQTDGEVRRIPEVGYNVYKKGYSEPTKGEGFSEIVQIDFIPSFNSKRDEALFKQWTSSERWWNILHSLC